MAKLAVEEAFVDLLVNNAGIGVAGEFHKHNAAELSRLINLNVRSLTALTHALLPAMLERGAGGIINVASLGGHVPGPNQAAYYASKAYVISLSEAVAAEVAREGVRVSALVPGPVATRFHARMGAESSLYRWLVPALPPRAVAWWAWLGHGLGLRVIVPGFLNNAGWFFLRYLPHRMVVPVVGWLLKPRRRETRDA
jgi:hypothetical protein